MIIDVPYADKIMFELLWEFQKIKNLRVKCLKGVHCSLSVQLHVHVVVEVVVKAMNAISNGVE